MEITNTQNIENKLSGKKTLEFYIIEADRDNGTLIPQFIFQSKDEVALKNRKMGALAFYSLEQWKQVTTADEAGALLKTSPGNARKFINYLHTTPMKIDEETTLYAPTLKKTFTPRTSKVRASTVSNAIVNAKLDNILNSLEEVKVVMNQIGQRVGFTSQEVTAMNAAFNKVRLVA